MGSRVVLEREPDDGKWRIRTLAVNKPCRSAASRRPGDLVIADEVGVLPAVRAGAQVLALARRSSTPRKSGCRTRPGFRSPIARIRARIRL